MNNKILIGSIIAVVILILVSFTGVVGYQTTSSTIARASPLFSVRSTRAIDEESRGLTCDYVGKGEENFLSIPKRDGRTALVQKFIDRISKMGDEAFDKLIGLVINRLEREPNINDKTISEIVTQIEQLRNEPMNPVNYRIFQKIGSDNQYATLWTYCSGGCDTWENNRDCFLFWLFLFLALIPMIIAMYIETLMYFFTILGCLQ